eukprot:TRINITY_DN2414_c0_g1_i1.p1 TRINITY_DN2414_c0_g1~~TRINITY_DN2414_c0_g1_i1.p1  ORF type:complete len:847 (+),score=138.12 TRINITY_DN2414_c0_g1_i1:46-2586(+)
MVFCSHGQSTLLSYRVNVIPQLILPAIFLERIIKADLPPNLIAIARRVENPVEEPPASVSENLSMTLLPSSKSINDPSCHEILPQIPLSEDSVSKRPSSDLLASDNPASEDPSFQVDSSDAETRLKDDVKSSQGDVRNSRSADLPGFGESAQHRRPMGVNDGHELVHIVDGAGFEGQKNLGEGWDTTDAVTEFPIDVFTGLEDVDGAEFLPETVGVLGEDLLSLRGSEAQLGVAKEPVATPEIPRRVELWAPKEGGVAEERMTLSGDDDMARFGGSGGSCRLGKVCKADEIHLRRLDDLMENGGVHRRVMASITVEASVPTLWSVLTDYERLPEFVPNLGASQVLSRDGHRVELRQEGCKCLMYMVLHAQVVLELTEDPLASIAFRQLKGDFASFYGRFSLEALGPGQTRLKYDVDTKMQPGIILAEGILEEVIYEDLPSNLCAIRERAETYQLEEDAKSSSPSQPSSDEEASEGPARAVRRLWKGRGKGDRRARRKDMASTSLSLPSPSPEEPVAKRLPSSFRVPPPSKAAYQKSNKALPTSLLDALPSALPSSRPVRGRPPKKLEGKNSAGQSPEGKKSEIKSRREKEEEAKTRRQEDLEKVKMAVLGFLAKRGEQAGVMPTRAQLRDAGESALEKGLTRVGGPRLVAGSLGLKLAYTKKPHNFWDDINNLRSEVAAFQQEMGTDEPEVLPPRRVFEEEGRYDIARAFEKWGGMFTVARLLDLKMHRRLQKKKPPVTSQVDENWPISTSNNLPNAEMNQYSQHDLSSPAPSSRPSNDSVNQKKGLGQEGKKKHQKLPMKIAVPATSKKWITIVRKTGNRKKKEKRMSCSLTFRRFCCPSLYVCF